MCEPNNGMQAPQQALTSLNIDYRHFDAEGIDPIYEFGFGLSFTTFEYSDLKITSMNPDAYVPGSGMTQAAPTFGANKTLGHYVSGKIRSSGVRN